MNILRNILLLNLLFLFSLASLAQSGKKRIILSTGDTVRVVTHQSLMSKQDRDFLRRDTISKKKILDIQSDYGTLEEAALDLEKLMDEINTSKSLSEKNNESLSVRIATRNLRNLKKEQDLKNTWDSIIANDPPMEELIELYKLFDGKPSYFINGIMVKSETINKLRPNEILSRNSRTIDTATGNPNGEIWYEVTPQALQRLAIKEDDSTTLPPASVEDIETMVKDDKQTVKKLEKDLKDEKAKLKQDSKEQKTEKRRSVKKIKERQAQK